MKAKWIIRVALGVGVSTALIALALKRFDLAAVWSTLRQSNPAFTGLAVMLLLGAFLLRAVRWYWILQKAGSRPAFNTVVQAVFAGFGINNLLPLRAGDLVRALAFPDKLDSRRSTLLGSLVFERVLDLLSLLIIGVIVLSSSSLPPWLRAAKVTFIAVAAVGIVCIFAVLVFVEQLRALFLRILAAAPFSEHLRHKAEGVVLLLMDFVATLGPRSVFQLGAVSFLIWAVEGTVYLCCALAVSSSNVTLGPLLAMVLANFSMLIPSAPGYVGTFHVSASAGLVALGVTTSTAAGFAILAHAVLWVPITATGMVSLLALRRSGKTLHDSRALAPIQRVAEDTGA